MNPIIVMTGQPVWSDTIHDYIPAGFELRSYPARERYVSRLTDDLAAMVLVDGADTDWLFWCATPKSSSATRRIPIVLVTDDAQVRLQAQASGADFVLSPDNLHQLQQIIADHARVTDPARAEQLDCECREPLPSLAQAGVEKFNNREFYPQHDLFEEQWVNTEGPVRDLYRAVLQVGVAYYQIERGNHRGALKMLMRAVQWLEALPDVCQTIDVARLREDAYAVRAALEAIDPDHIDEFDMSLLKPVQVVSSHDG